MAPPDLERIIDGDYFLQEAWHGVSLKRIS
jgi:hypothetical protein